MTSKRRASKRRAPARRDDDDAWREVARQALSDAIGAKDAVVLVDSLDGAPPRVTVSLAIAAPHDLVPKLRAHSVFAETIAAVRAALARALPDVELVLRLVPAAIVTTREMLALALDAAGLYDVADAFSLPPSPERRAPPDIEEGRNIEVTSLRIRQIEATALRRLAILRGSAMPVDGELLVDGSRRGPDERPTTAAFDEDEERRAFPPDRALEWFPVRSLYHETEKPRFWLIARLGRVVVVRKAQRMRSLAEKRYEHADEARARADFDRRLAEKLAAGWVDIHHGSLETALLYHEPLIPEMDRALVRSAARALLATAKWKEHTLSPQALVRTLGATGDPRDADLARALVARIDRESPSRLRAFSRS